MEAGFYFCFSGGERLVSERGVHTPRAHTHQRLAAWPGHLASAVRGEGSWGSAGSRVAVPLGGGHGGCPGPRELCDFRRGPAAAHRYHCQPPCRFLAFISSLSGSHGVCSAPRNVLGEQKVFETAHVLVVLVTKETCATYKASFEKMMVPFWDCPTITHSKIQRDLKVN